MRDKQNADQNRQRTPLLLVSPAVDDRLSLERLIDNSQAGTCSCFRWSVVQHRVPGPIMTALKRSRIPVVICDDDAWRGFWRLLVEELAQWPEPPLLIVTSRLADERLWAEALNLGAWDVLAKPLDKEELNRTLHSAWLRWSNRHPGGPTARHEEDTEAAEERPSDHTGLVLKRRLQPVIQEH